MRGVTDEFFNDFFCQVRMHFPIVVFLHVRRIQVLFKVFFDGNRENGFMEVECFTDESESTVSDKRFRVREILDETLASVKLFEDEVVFFFILFKAIDDEFMFDLFEDGEEFFITFCGLIDDDVFLRSRVYVPNLIANDRVNGVNVFAIFKMHAREKHDEIHICFFHQEF